jgi:[acyl-carrier-protein] S-malonyltransferase
VPETVAIVCPGQGSQRHGMLYALPDPDALSRLLDAAEALSGLELRAIADSGTAEQMADTRAAQPLLYLADWAWGEALLDSGVRPVAFAGHSLGELAALALAGAFSVEAGLELVIERSRLMAQCAANTPGGMLAVLGMDGPLVSTLVEPLSGVWVANDNAPGQVVITGTHDGLERATAALTEAGARRLVPLNVAGPFHSPLMQPAATAFADLLAQTTFEDVETPVLQNTDPTPATSGEVLRQRLATQMVSPVRWTETMRNLTGMGVTMLVEAGPGSVLSGLARRMENLSTKAVEVDGVDQIAEEV